MIGFHIDMNVVQYTKNYLKAWLQKLAAIGYDTIIWEVENNIQWETCPECVSPDAFSKAEFKELLDYCAELGLASIPLLQIIGHCEYVLKHDAYKHLSELPDQIGQYCPLKPEVTDFLKKWINEYFEVFGDINYFHIGADEAWSLGSCPACKKYAEEHSLSELYINHVNTLAQPVIGKGITPIIWCDMILHHNEALELLDRKIMVFDWMYDIYRGDGKVWVWGEDKKSKTELTQANLDRFGAFLFPDGDEPGQEPETFYTADFLADQKLATVTCPGSSSYGDNVFTPRHYYHLANTFDSIRKGQSSHLQGSVLTSWSVHLFPWELQGACIAMPAFLKAESQAPLKDYQTWFSQATFGLSEGDNRFWQATGLLSKSCAFTFTGSLGFNKACLQVDKEHVSKYLDDLAEKGKLEDELANCKARLEEYDTALELLAGLIHEVTVGKELLDMWYLAAHNLVNRAEASIFLISKRLGTAEGDPAAILTDLQKLKAESEAMYKPMVRPSRRAEMMAWIYDSIEYELSQ